MPMKIANLINAIDIEVIADIFNIIFPLLSGGLLFILFLKSKINHLLNSPIDFELTINNRRIFGEHKTFRGPIVIGLGTAIFGGIGCTLESIFIKYPISPISLSEIFVIFFKYLIVGISYSLGELPNSFIKRQLDIPPGKESGKKFLKALFKWADNFDSLVACSIAYYLLFSFSTSEILTALTIGGVLHLITDKLMERINLK